MTLPSSPCSLAPLALTLGCHWDASEAEPQPAPTNLCWRDLSLQRHYLLTGWREHFCKLKSIEEKREAGVSQVCAHLSPEDQRQTGEHCRHGSPRPRRSLRAPQPRITLPALATSAEPQTPSGTRFTLEITCSSLAGTTKPPRHTQTDSGAAFPQQPSGLWTQAKSEHVQYHNNRTRDPLLTWETECNKCNYHSETVKYNIPRGNIMFLCEITSLLISFTVPYFYLLFYLLLFYSFAIFRFLYLDISECEASTNGATLPNFAVYPGI